MIVLLGFAGGVRNVVENRTQGGDVGRVIAAESESGDVVVYCPDQLGPAVSRTIGDRPGLTQVVFPTGDGPSSSTGSTTRTRNSGADARRFVDTVFDEVEDDNTVWFVASYDYQGGYEGKCEADRARARRASTRATVVVGQDESFESMGLLGIQPA